ncbi:MAG: GGDEF domain-containing protein [Phycisphaerales bacterium]|nr:GGDEF domain-containing protein [Phycisphaerales bacterium]
MSHDQAVTARSTAVGARLATMPAVAAWLVDVTADEAVDPATVARIVGLDHALTSTVLRAAGAADSEPCGSVHEAVDRLGTGAVTSLALGSMLAEGLNAHTPDLDEAAFRRWSIHVAVSAGAIARATGVWNEAQAHAAGLLQDAGVLAMCQRFGRAYARLLGATADDHHSLASREREAFGFDHVEVGAQLARRWCLSDEMIAAIGHHHDADAATEFHVECRVLDLGGTLASVLLGGQPELSMQSFRRRADEWFALGAAGTEDLVRQVANEAGSMLAELRIESGETPDVERLLMRAEEQWVRQQARMGRRNRELERRNRDLAERAHRDTLTGVGTRSLLERELPRCRDHCARTCRPLAVAFIDVDGLKPVNDQLGHATGDDVLRRLASSISAAAGEDATVCRFGGDEFVVIMPGRDLAGAAMVADQMRRGAQQAGRRCGDEDLAVTLSIGCAALGSDELEGRAVHRLVCMADEAMYVAKRSGGNRVEVAAASSNRAA